MPRLAGRPCSHPGCPNLVRDRSARYCPEHLKQARAEQDAKRGSPAERGYGARWREIRERFLRDHPRCAHCGRRATVAHHIRRRRAGGSDDPSNLLALCASCHGREHGESGDSWRPAP